MKKILWFGILLFLILPGLANATLTAIGTATYNESEYNLIWDDDNNGNSVVWLDYSHYSDDWDPQVAWASTLNDEGVLTINLYDGYTVDWGTNLWRLPTTVDGLEVYGYEGDPDGDGNYTYTKGYNLANSEMGHLFYEELGNLGYIDTSGSSPDLDVCGLIQTDDFNELTEESYWSGTEYAYNTSYAWYFDMAGGFQSASDSKYAGAYALALRTGEVSVVPVPGTFWLLGLGITSLAGLSRKKFNRA
ncbi:PEP-CTERM sorting domain-containing protein [uncultured Desulfobacter sp.]|uniref:PEP-CTERM sorting domain-containing protein n=1 Tax=uncultured Desulfobacter sp. TaxID=240139 RepID=UPI0029F52801|nr:PEP-CTERM sorting domain-containing protein [uncultured Desulfobacter sp.]